MKVWFAISAGCSLLLLTALVLSISSCAQEFAIDAQGRLVTVSTIETEGSPPTVQYQVAQWEKVLPEFREIAPRLLPGDRLTHTRQRTLFPFLNLQTTRLDVVRNEARVLVLRDGAFRFWAVITGISVFPLLCWAGGALWAMSGRPRHGGLGPPQ